MKLDELIVLIQTKTGMPVNQTQLANSLGITRQTISNRIKNDSQVTVSELEKVETFFNICLFNSNYEPDNEIIYIDYYSDVFASCGQGNTVFSETKNKLPIPISFIKDFSRQKEYSIINATGDSMMPTIENGDKLIVEKWSGLQIQDNKIYVFSFNNEIFIKRLSKNLDEIIIKSDNPEYRQRTISCNSGFELNLFGKIIGIIKSL